MSTVFCIIGRSDVLDVLLEEKSASTKKKNLLSISLIMCQYNVSLNRNKTQSQSYPHEQ